MAQMTVTPVATHGFFLDGKWLEEGDIVDLLRFPNAMVRAWLGI